MEILELEIIIILCIIMIKMQVTENFKGAPLKLKLCQQQKRILVTNWEAGHGWERRHLLRVSLWKYL